MIERFQLVDIITASLIIVSSEGGLTAYDENILTNFIQDQCKAGVWDDLRRSVMPNDIIMDAVNALKRLTPNRDIRSQLGSLRYLNDSQKSNVMAL